MSEFLVIKNKDPKFNGILNIRFNAITGDSFLTKAISSITSEIDLSHYLLIVDSFDNTSDYLFTEAQLKLHNGEAFSQTRIYQIVFQAFELGYELIMWYASDYNGLEIYNNKDVFIKYLETSIDESFCEASGRINYFI